MHPQPRSTDTPLFPSLAGTGKLIVGLVLILVVLIVVPLTPTYAAPLRALNPVPTVSFGGVPSEGFIGENFTFTLTFDNTGALADDTGYGPYIDLYLPVTGADGDGDGIDFVSATYLSTNLTTTELTFNAAGEVTHPYAVNPGTGTPVIVTGGTPGDKLVVIRLPFGSFTRDQPPIEIDVTASISNFANANTALTMYARGGFQYGGTPLNDWCCGTPPDATIYNPTGAPPTWPPASITPVLMTVDKTYDGPESETATGPNFPRSYTITVDIADGQTVNNLQVTDTLPDTVQYLSVNATPAGAGLISTPGPGPGGTVTYDFGNVAGGPGVDATLTINFYVPLDDASGTSVLSAATGDDVSIANTASASGNWTPLDTDDPAGPVTGSCPGPCPGGGFDAKSLAIQKSVALATDNGYTGYTPGDTVEYTLNFQISDFFAFQNLSITDILSDGQTYVNGSARMSITTHTGDSADAPMNAANVSVTAAPTPGQTTLVFDISGELGTRGLSGQLLGGCVPAGGTGGGAPGNPPDCGTFNGGPTTGTITFRATIDENYTDPVPSGDQSVDHGDTLSNTVQQITGDLLNVGNLTPNGNSETDDSSAQFEIVKKELVKSIYGYTPQGGSFTPGSPGSNPLSPGDTITYRLEFELPSSDFESLSFTDYLPLPVLYATEITTFDDVTDANPPAAGHAKFGPTDTFSGAAGISGIVPTISVDPDANSVSFDYGTYDGSNTTPSKIDILLTVTISDDPFTDGLLLTNQARSSESNSFNTVSTSDAIIQFVLGEPLLTTTKSVVATNNPGATYSGTLPTATFTNPPDTSIPRWSGTIDASGIGNANVSDLDGGDLVTFALMIQNTGSSPGGAFDITIRDELQSPDFQIPGHGVDGINLSVTYGDGTPVSYTALNAADPVPLFGDGIEIVDPGPAQGACEAPGHTAGRDIIIITYDLRIRPGIAPNTVITNTGHIMSYSNTEGGPDFLPNTPNDDLTERASTTIGSNAGKSGTPTALTVGQTYRQRITVEIPPNTSMQEWPAGSGSGVVILRDSLLSNGMHGLTSTATFTPGASCSNTNFSDPTFQSAISVTTTDTGPGEDIIWSFPAPIDNTGGTSSCGFTVEIDVLIMDADFYDGSRNWLPPTNNSMVATDNAIVQYSDGSRNLQFSSGTYSINVDQPVINLTKTITAVYESDGVTPRPAGQELRRGDIIVWTVRMENVGESGAYEVSFEDQLSVNQAFVSGSAFLDNGAGNPANAGNGVQDAGEISLANPTTSGSPTVAPGQLLNFHYPAYEDLAPGDTFYVSYRTQILDTMDLGTVLNNNADADWSTLDGNQTYERVYDDSAPIANDSGNSGTDDQDSDSAQVINLTIDKSFSPNIVGASPPGTATMTLTINNPNTNTNLTGVSVTDNLPAGLEVASPPNVVGNCNGGTVTATAGSRTVSLTGGSLLAGNSCSIQVDVVPTAEGVYENETGQVTSTESGPDGTASATLIAANDLAVHKEFNPQSITAGGTSTLTITIFYPGPLANVTNVSVDDTLPNGVTVVNPGVTTGVCNGGTLTTTATTISLTGGSLAQGGYCSFDVPVTSSRPGTYPNTTGPVSSNETGQTTPSNTATLTVESLPAPTGYVVFHDPGLSKIGSPSDARLGETIIWTITVSNPSSVPMSPVFVNDPLPDILDIIGVTTTHGTATWAGQVVTADIGPLNPGETATITVESVTNNTALPGEVCNAASVQATMDSGAGPVTSTANMEGCITLYPLTLPQTGGSPVQSHRWQRALAALLLVGGALGAFAYRRRKRGASLLSR